MAVKPRGSVQTKPTGLLWLHLFLWSTGVDVSAFSSSSRIGAGRAASGSQVNLLGSPSPGYFSSLTPPVKNGVHQSAFGAKFPSKGFPLRETTSSARGLSSQDEAILREFEKKEALIRKRRTEALSKLSEYEATLEKLRSTKAEYVAAAQMAKPPLGGTFSETALRSVVKSFCWRVVAGSVTFVTSLQFSGSMKTALQLVGADFFSKAVTMFVGERLMNKSKAGRATGSDNVGRSAAKALLWRLFAICNTLCFALFISKDLSVAGKIASTDAVFKTALMFAYERVWARVQWGKEYLLEYAI